MKLISFRAGIANVFLIIQDKKCLLVDTGSRGREKFILKSITSRGFKSTDLKYIFLTHTHFDHAGSAAELQKLTGAQIILHQSETDWLEEGFTPIPKGTDWLHKIISAMGNSKRVEKKVGWFQPAIPDIRFTDNFSLNPYGFDAQLIYTPGHTRGSSSLIMKKKAIVGDAMFNLYGSYWPGFANDEELLKNTWQRLLKLDVDWYYPSHGKRIAKHKLLKEARKRGIL